MLSLVALAPLRARRSKDEERKRAAVGYQLFAIIVRIGVIHSAVCTRPCQGPSSIRRRVSHREIENYANIISGAVPGREAAATARRNAKRGVRGVRVSSLSFAIIGKQRRGARSKFKIRDASLRLPVAFAANPSHRTHGPSPRSFSRPATLLASSRLNCVRNSICDVR